MKMFTRLKLYDFSRVQRVDEEASTLIQLDESTSDVELQQIAKSMTADEIS